MNNFSWEKYAANKLKSEIKKHGLTYKGLSEKLAEIGIKEPDYGISAKVYRGTFSCTFYLQCMRAMGVKKMYIDDLYED